MNMLENHDDRAKNKAHKALFQAWKKEHGLEKLSNFLKSKKKIIITPRINPKFKNKQVMFDKPLTLEDHREVSSDIFYETKLPDTNSVKIVGEYIQNISPTLETTLTTFAHLHDLGISFHKGNFEERSRYMNMFHPFGIYFVPLINKLRKL
jgi:hypothetical protein